MNFWVLVITLIAVAMALGPLLMLQPSRGDRRREAFRQRATELGLRVTLEAPPQQVTDMETPGHQPVYRLPVAAGEGSREAWILLRAAYRHDVHFLGEWRWHGPGRPSEGERHCLAQWLPELPPSVSAVGADRRGWYLFWEERGEVSEVELLARYLCDLRDCSPSPASVRG